MKSIKLNFGKIIPLQENIAEVVVNSSVELNEGDVQEFHNVLRSNLVAPFSLLINKINIYSYSFKALETLGAMSEINRIGIVTYNDISKIITKMAIDFPREKEWNVEIFNNTTEALNWLSQ